MKVRKGDYIYRNETLAQRMDSTAALFCKAPSTGTVTDVDLKNGFVTIEYLHQPIEYQADTDGRISSVTDGQGLSIQFKAQRMEGRIGFGKSCHGPLRVIATEQDMDRMELEGAVAVLGFSPEAHHLNTLAQKGIHGLLCYCLRAATLSEYLGFEPGVIITGNETLPFTVLILGGFASTAMPETSLAALRSMEGHNVWLSPNTRIRAGVVRPYLAISI